MSNESLYPQAAVAFEVSGQPLPKQSFRVGAHHGYTDARIKGWQERVGYAARDAMRGRNLMTGPLRVEITFYRKSRARADLDNLSKAVLDACNMIIWQDDQQVIDLHLVKQVHRTLPRIVVKVYEQEGLC